MGIMTSGLKIPVFFLQSATKLLLIHRFAGTLGCSPFPLNVVSCNFPHKSCEPTLWEGRGERCVSTFLSQTVGSSNFDNRQFPFLLFRNFIISECELILNHTGVSCTKEEQMKMVVCPKHHFKLTTLFRPKVTFISCNSNFD